MLKYLQKFLGKLGEFEYKYLYLVILLIIIVTGIAFVGLTKLEYESDFSEFDPTHIDVVALDKRVSKEYGGFKSFLVIVQLDPDFESDINDIRDPKVMEFLVDVSRELSKEPKIQSVNSAGMIFQGGVPEDIESVKMVLSQVPGSSNFFNSRYSLTPIFISVDVSGDNEKINEINDRVREVVESSSKPGGIKVAVTGEPPLLSQIFELMIQDGIYTLIIAIIVIFIMLLIIQRSFKDSIVIILPVLFGVVWTIGGMGWFGIKITIATAAIGAMLLGLGVEYSIFLNTRYKEEKKDRIDDAIIKALSTTGASTFSSGVTTMIGFFALSLSTFPMLSDLGFSLGMGILFILVSVIVVGPMLIIIRDRFFDFNRQVKKSKKKKDESIFLKTFQGYGKIISNWPWTVVIVFLILTGVMFYGSVLIKNVDIDFDTILPSDLEELKAFNLMQNEFEDTTSILIFIELDPTLINSNEPIDMRDPRIIRYVDRLSQKARLMSFSQDVDSLSEVVKDSNNGIIPGSLSENKKLLENAQISHLVNDDYSNLLIRVKLNEVAENHREDVINQVYEIVENTNKPPGIKTHVTGGMIVSYELDKLIGPDSSKTAIVAFVIIIVFLFLLSRSFKYTVLPLVTVVIAILWIMGMIGYLQVGWNSIISSVISMSIGIGIDFGIQLSNRFRQELETHDKKKAMCITLKYTMYPMIITVVAALIGFQAMNLGQLKLMGDLGRTMSFAMVSSMIVAVTIVASLMVIFERDKKNIKKLKNWRK